MRKMIIWILYILMGVQIAFGCAFFICNFTVEQQFGENLPSLLPMWAVCLLQLTLAGIAVWYVSGKFGIWTNNYVRGYVCAFLLTVPYLLQMHMARLPWSAAFSAFLWLFGLLLEAGRSGLSGQKILLLCAAWFSYGVICPDGLWSGVILLGSAFLLQGGLRQLFYRKKSGKDGLSSAESEEKQKRSGKIRCCGLAFLVTAGVIFAANSGLNRAFPEARRLYRENTLGAAVVSRLVWPNFGRNYYFWSDEVKEVLTEYEAVQISQRVDLIGEEFYPRLEATYGKRKAVTLCFQMGWRCLMDRTRETVFEIGRDLKDYVLLPFTIDRNLRGEGVSLTAWNYGRMREHTPVLVKYYFRYGIFELPFLLLGSLLLRGFQKSDRFGQLVRRRSLSAQWKFLFMTGIFHTIWYTVRSNFPVDYKMALPIVFVWYLASVSGVLCLKPEGKETQMSVVRSEEDI